MIIRLTEKQLKEATGMSFEYLKGGDDNEYRSQMEISVSGNPGLYDEVDIEPRISDDIADEITRPGWFATFRGTMPATMMVKEEENKANGIANDNQNVNNFNEKTTGQLDALSNGDKNDNLVYVPNTVQMRIDALLAQMKTDKLNGKQCAMVLNKLLEQMDFSNIPYNWRKTLRLKINA